MVVFHDVDMEDLNSKGVPYESVGVILKVYSEFKPWIIDKVLSRQQFDEVRFLLSEAAAFTKERSCVVNVEFAGEDIGRVRRGIVGKSITEGLIAPWESSLSEGFHDPRNGSGGHVS